MRLNGTSSAYDNECILANAVDAAHFRLIVRPKYHKVMINKRAGQNRVKVATRILSQAIIIMDLKVYATMNEPILK